MPTDDTTYRTLLDLITAPTLPEDFSEQLDAAILEERHGGAEPGAPSAREEVTTVSGMTAGQEKSFDLFLRRPSVQRRAHPDEQDRPAHRGRQDAQVGGQAA